MLDIFYLLNLKIIVLSFNLIILHDNFDRENICFYREGQNIF
jgi:hypothetical protein